MANNDDFDFDDFSLNGSNESDDDAFNQFGGSTEINDGMGDTLDDGFGDLANHGADDRKSTKKVSIVAIICGVLLVVIIFCAVGLINKFGGQAKERINGTESTGTEQVEGSQGENPKTPVTPSQGTVKPTESNSEWSEISGEPEIDFSKEYMDTTFTITSIKHYAKVLKSVESLEIKTVVQGAIAGLDGTYEFEIPYSKGSKVSVGTKIAIQVQIGTYSNGYTVVGEIKY